MFLLDTDHLGIIQAEKQPEYDRIRARMDEYSPDDFSVSIVSFHEQVNGWNAYLNRAKGREGMVMAYDKFLRILADFARMNVAPFDMAAATTFESLRGQGIRIGTMDLRIAAIALARNWAVLTRNLVDFEKVPGLSVEDWTISR